MAKMRATVEEAHGALKVKFEREEIEDGGRAKKGSFRRPDARRRE